MRDNKNNYATPRVLSRLVVVPDVSILQGSITDALNMGGVDTTAQEVETIDFNENPFQHEWQ